MAMVPWRPAWALTAPVVLVSPHQVEHLPVVPVAQDLLETPPSTIEASTPNLIKNICFANSICDVHADGRTGADAWGSSNTLFNNGHHGNNGAGSWSSGFDSAFSPGASGSIGSARSTVSSDSQGSPRFQSEVFTKVMMGNGTVRRERQVVNNFNS